MFENAERPHLHLRQVQVSTAGFAMAPRRHSALRSGRISFLVYNKAGAKSKVVLHISFIIHHLLSKETFYV